MAMANSAAIRESLGALRVEERDFVRRQLAGYGDRQSCAVQDFIAVLEMPLKN